MVTELEQCGIREGSNIQTQYVKQGLTQDGQRNDCISHLEQRSIFQKAQLALNLGGDWLIGKVVWSSKT